MDLSFLAPARLVFVIVPIVLAVAYLAMQARRRRYALRFTTIDLLDEVAPDRPGWRRHLPALVLLVGLLIATLAVARPAVAKSTEQPQKIVVLAIDTSLSMEAVDVDPSRIEAAKAAASEFLHSVPEGVAVGVVGFDGQARGLIAPTTNLDAVQRVIDHAQLGEGTAIGDAVFLGLDEIATAHEQLDANATSKDESPGTIVLLSDGETTAGRPNDEAAAEAKAQHVAVHTIAFGTDAGHVTDPSTGQEVPVPVNKAALAQLAQETGGLALQAETQDQLTSIYERLGQAVTVDVQRTEVTDWFAAIAVALLTLAAAGSLIWFGRLP